MNCHSLQGTGGTFGPALDKIGAGLSKEEIERWQQADSLLAFRKRMIEGQALTAAELDNSRECIERSRSENAQEDAGRQEVPPHPFLPHRSAEEKRIFRIYPSIFAIVIIPARLAPGPRPKVEECGPEV
jgi:hypothetical protein